MVDLLLSDFENLKFEFSDLHFLLEALVTKVFGIYFRMKFSYQK